MCRVYLFRRQNIISGVVRRDGQLSVGRGNIELSAALPRDDVAVHFIELVRLQHIKIFLERQAVRRKKGRVRRTDIPDMPRLEPDTGDILFPARVPDNEAVILTVFVDKLPRLRL